MTDLRTPTTVHGWTDPAFEGVRDVFAGNFEKGLEVGAAFSAYHRGRKVVDVWGGIADRQTGRPWEEDTMILVFSTTKAATALCVNILAERGLLDVTAPVARYWPEFAQSGKEEISVTQLLSHQAGLAWVDTRMSLEDVCRWEPMIRVLEAEAPHWEPGTRHGYHATTFGWLAGELVRRIDGRSLGTFFHDEVAAPLGLDFYIGLPERFEPRVAPIIPFEMPDLSGFGLESSSGDGDSGGDPGGDGDGTTGAPARVDNLKAIGDLLGHDMPIVKALNTPPGAFPDFGVWNDRALRAAEIPAANGVTDARSLARMYAGMVSEVDAVRVLGEQQLRRALVQQTVGPDFVLFDLDMQWGLGFMVLSSLTQMGVAQGATNGFGHFGAGGSAGWGDPDAELAFGYVMNRMDIGLTGDTRSAALIDAVYEAAGSLGA